MFRQLGVPARYALRLVDDGRTDTRNQMLASWPIPVSRQSAVLQVSDGRQLSQIGGSGRTVMCRL
jgi:hypothetical protein